MKKCPLCLWEKSSFHEHHVVYKSRLGGGEEMNLISICKSCHSIITSFIGGGSSEDAFIRERTCYYYQSSIYGTKWVIYYWNKYIEYKKKYCDDKMRNEIKFIRRSLIPIIKKMGDKAVKKESLKKYKILSRILHKNEVDKMQLYFKLVPTDKINSFFKMKNKFLKEIILTLLEKDWKTINLDTDWNYFQQLDKESNNLDIDSIEKLIKLIKKKGKKLHRFPFDFLVTAGFINDPAFRNHKIEIIDREKVEEKNK